MTTQRTARLRISAIDVTDLGGHVRRYPDQKDVIYITHVADSDTPIRIGSDADKASSETWQLQVVARNQDYQMVNRGNNEVRLEVGRDPFRQDVTELKPKQATTLSYEQVVRINSGYAISVFRRQIAENFNVRLFLAETELRQQHDKTSPLRGELMLYHTGKTPQVQFHLYLDMDGLPSEAYRLETRHPKFDHTTERLIDLAFFHPPDRPLLAGDYLLTAKVETDEYPGQIARDCQILRINPFYRHHIKFAEDDR